MIEIINHENGLPISVIIPVQKKRLEFFTQFTLPLLISQDEQDLPAEVIINIDEVNAAKNRNFGFRHSTQPYIMFLDDDKLLPKDYLKILYKVLINDTSVDFVYTGYTGIVLHPNTHPLKTNYKIPTRDFDLQRLKRGNYIDTTSLMRRTAFPGFDESLAQHDDWDLYLNMASHGSKGKAVHGLEFFSFFLDEGITSINNKDCSDIIRKRYEHL